MILMELMLSYQKRNDKDNKVRMMIVSARDGTKVQIRHALSFSRL